MTKSRLSDEPSQTGSRSSRYDLEHHQKERRRRKISKFKSTHWYGCVCVSIDPSESVTMYGIYFTYPSLAGHVWRSSEDVVSLLEALCVLGRGWDHRDLEGLEGATRLLQGLRLPNPDHTWRGETTDRQTLVIFILSNLHCRGTMLYVFPIS